VSTLTVLNPATEEPLVELPEAGVEEANRAVAAAKSSFPGWRAVAPADRGRLLRRLATLVEENREELALLETRNVGKPIGDSRGEVGMVADVFHFYAGAVDKHHGETIPVAGGVDFTLREPLGVVGLIVPWNFPIAISSWKLGPALACGNTVVLKPAELTPLTAQRLGELALEAGLPEGVVNVVVGPGRIVGQRLVEHPDVAKIGFTGSTEVGRKVMEGAAGTIRTSTLADPPRLVLDVARPTEPAAREGREQRGPLKMIVLDAGHGGHDSGALGPTGLMEKDLVLDVTRRVAKLVEERLGIKVRLTRDADHFVTLRDRTSFANRERADLFVSIHANAHRETAADGVETYFLSSEATDSAARQVAALENGVVQLEQPSGRPSGQVDIVRAILWDLAQSEFQTESSRLAEVVHDSMTQSLRISNRGVKQAGFYVLGGAAMPAILIEIGFVTNPREERRLKETKYRDEIARAILAGLAEYKRAWDQRARAAAEPPSMTRAR